MSNIISSFSNLSKVLSNGEFAITAETTPKATTDINSLIKKTIPLKGLADAVNVTDGAGAKSHLSSLILALHLLENDIEPILQLFSLILIKRCF